MGWRAPWLCKLEPQIAEKRSINFHVLVLTCKLVLTGFI